MKTRPKILQTAGFAVHETVFTCETGKHINIELESQKNDGQANEIGKEESQQLAFTYMFAQ